MQPLENEKREDKPNDSQEEGMKFIFPCNIINFYTRLEVLIGLKVFGHADTLKEASNIIDELDKICDIDNEQQDQNALEKFSTQKMGLPSKLLERIAFITRPKIEEHMLIVMDKSTHDEHLIQLLQTKNKQFKVAVNFSTGYNGMFNDTTSYNKFYFAKSNTDKNGFKQTTFPQSAFELGYINDEIMRLLVKEKHFTGANCPCKIKPNFSALGSVEEVSRE